MAWGGGAGGGGSDVVESGKAGEEIGTWRLALVWGENTSGLVRAVAAEPGWAVQILVPVWIVGSCSLCFWCNSIMRS